MVVYIDDFNNAESVKKIKNFRKFNTKNTDKYFHMKFWIVEDKELARQLKISTEPEDIGDLYLVRMSSEFNNFDANTNLSGYKFKSEKILSCDEVANDATSSYASILQFAFNSPIVVHDYMAFAMLSQKFKTNMFVIYCDKEDKENYEKVLTALIKARNQMPIKLKPDADSGDLKKEQKK